MPNPVAAWTCRHSVSCACTSAAHLQGHLAFLLGAPGVPFACSQEKIEIIAKETYKAGGVEYLPQAEKQIELYTRMGFAGLPICMAKTQARTPALDNAKAVP